MNDAPLPGVTRLPFIPQRTKPMHCEAVEDVRQFGQQPRQQLIPLRKRGHQRIDRRHRHHECLTVSIHFRRQQIQPDPDDRARLLGITAQLNQNAPEFGIAMKNVIRPLERRPTRAACSQRPHDGQANAQRQA